MKLVLVDRAQDGDMMSSSAVNRTLDCVAAPYRALLEMTRLIAAHRDLPTLLEELTGLLHTVAPFDYLSVMLYQPETDSFCVIYPGIPSRPVLRSAGFGFDDGPGGVVWLTQKSMVCNIEEIERKFPKIAALRREQRIVASCIVPLTTSLRRIGVLEFLSTHAGVYRQEDIDFMEQVASQVAMAVDNAMHHESARASQERIETLLKVSNAVVSSLDLQELLKGVAHSVNAAMGAAFCSLVLYQAANQTLRWEALHNCNGRTQIKPGRTIPLGDSPVATAFKLGEPVCISKQELIDWATRSHYAAMQLSEGLQAVCCVPLVAKGRVMGVLNVGHMSKEDFMPGEVQLLVEIANQISASVDNARAYTEISQLKDKLSTEKLYLEQEIRGAFNFGEMIGESTALRRVMDQIEMVAHSDATVLILGETGTGKELVARAIHDLSQRSSRTLMKLNCAAIPLGLLESDLFGHEKGSFTGAIAQKTGRFELANNGTLFLDEIGDLPLELQPKLLRAIQEGEIERLGGSHPIKVNVRLIAATHRNLDQMLMDGRFRQDLYYRLNVFPIILPPLRERAEDIVPLTRHFTQKYAQRMGKVIERIPTSALQMLKRMPWPGNIRELENVIERAVITTQGPVLNLALSEMPAAALPQPTRFRVSGVPTELAQADESALREAIIEALRECNGRVAGPHGAAQKLGMTRGRLLSAAQRLKISVYPEGVGSRERTQILEALRNSNGMISGPNGAAQKLGLSRTTLYSRMQRLGISRHN